MLSVAIFWFRVKPSEVKTYWQEKGRIKKLLLVKSTVIPQKLWTIMLFWAPPHCVVVCTQTIRMDIKMWTYWIWGQAEQSSSPCGFGSFLRNLVIWNHKSQHSFAATASLTMLSMDSPTSPYYSRRTKKPTLMELKLKWINSPHYRISTIMT